MKSVNLMALAALLATSLVVRPAAAYVIITYSKGPYVAPGETAVAALEIADGPATAVDGDVRKGDIIARRQVRAHDAVVLDAPVQGSVGLMRAGAVLVRVNYGKSGSAWCDVSPWLRVIRADVYDCLEDPEGGAFKRLSKGFSQVKFQGFERSGLVRGNPLAAPAPFHRAAPGEQPVAVLGYRFCGGNGVTGPPRFSLALTPFGQADFWPYEGECAFGVWTKPGDPSAVDIDGLSATFTANAAGGFHYRVDGRAPAGVMPTLTSTGSARPATAAKAGPAAGSLTQARGEQTLVLGGAAPTIASGEVRVGQSFAQAGVRHGVTGLLQNRIRPGDMWRKDTPIEVGQPMFGIVTAERQIIWCAPRLPPPGGGGYDTACFLTTKPISWLPHRKPALMPWDSLYEDVYASPVNGVPSVVRQPIALPPMTLSLALAAMKPPRQDGGPTTIGVDWLIDWGEGPQKFRSLYYEVAPGGAWIDILGIRIHVGISPDGSAILVG